MKKIKFLLVCLFAVLTGLYIMSCSSKDDDEDSSNPIVGTWVCSTYDSYSGYNSEENYIMFCSNGTAYVFDIYSKDDIDVEKCEYVYNATTGKLVMNYIEYKDTETYEILSLDSKKMVAKKGSRTETYTKTKSPISATELEKLSQRYVSD